MRGIYPGEGFRIALNLAMNVAGAVLFLESADPLLEISGIGLCCLGWYLFFRFYIWCDDHQGQLRREHQERQARKNARSDT